MRARHLVPFLLLAACQTRLCRDPKVWVPVEYVAPRVATPPVIDGALDDAAWAKAPWTPAFRKSNANEAPRQLTRAKLVWDDQFVYAAFDVSDDEILTPFQNDDDNLYESEVVELFFDANQDLKTYDEVELSPADKLFDANFKAYRAGMNRDWASGARHAVRLDGTLNQATDTDRGWTAELALPIASLSVVPHVPPQPGDRWRMNLFRLDHGHGREEGQAFSSVMVGDFHHLQKYGTLVFGP